MELQRNSRRPRSLRVRLLLWYGTLLALALGSFAVLILFLATDAISQSVDSAIRAEARIALLDVSRELSPTPPYWPVQLSLPVIDTYRDPGIVVEVVDTQGHPRYPSTNGTTRSISISADTAQTLFTGQTVWYSTTIGGEHARVEAVPIRAPVADGTSSAAPIVGGLLVAKSLSDVDATLFLLQTLLLLVGLITLVGALIGSWIVATRRGTCPPR